MSTTLDLPRRSLTMWAVADLPFTPVVALALVLLLLAALAVAALAVLALLASEKPWS